MGRERLEKMPVSKKLELKNRFITTRWLRRINFREKSLRYNEKEGEGLEKLRAE